MDLANARKSIIKNTLWGNLNIVVRYVTSFVATIVIARNYSPEDFGLYQLLMTYLGVIEVINILHPNHLRNYLVTNPHDEGFVIKAWSIQAFWVWFLTSAVLLVCALLSNESGFWWLLLLANVRMVFRVFDSTQIVFDYRLRSELTQKIQIVYAASFNFVRIFVACLRANMWILVGSSIFQGLFGTLYQKHLKNSCIGKVQGKFSWDKFVELAKAGAFLNIILVLTSAQSRILSALVVEKMSRSEFGNFQLIVKLVEPATSIGTVVFAANYTVLAHTLKNKKSDFRKRFLKVSFLAGLIGVFCGVIIILFPKAALMRFFGKDYAPGIEALWLGVSIIFANIILATSIQFDILTSTYRSALVKYIAILSVFGVYLFSIKTISLSHAVLLQAIVPISIVLLWDTCRGISFQFGKGRL